MKSLYESILSSTGTGKTGIIKAIENRDFTPDVIQTLDKTVAFYKVKDERELKPLIEEYISAAGKSCSLNWIDTSGVTDMFFLFSYNTTRIFNGNISKWDVSNVVNMSYMFEGSDFNSNISDWDVSNVTDMSHMFSCSDFNNNISKWDVSNVKSMFGMFYNNKKFNGNISDWDVSNVINMSYMFCGSKKFNQDISGWDVSKARSSEEVFIKCPIKPDYKPKKFR